MRGAAEMVLPFEVPTVLVIGQRVEWPARRSGEVLEVVRVIGPEWDRRYAVRAPGGFSLVAPGVELRAV